MGKIITKEIYSRILAQKYENLKLDVSLNDLELCIKKYLVKNIDIDVLSDLLVVNNGLSSYSILQYFYDARKNDPLITNKPTRISTALGEYDIYLSATMGSGNAIDANNNTLPNYVPVIYLGVCYKKSNIVNFFNDEFYKFLKIKYLRLGVSRLTNLGVFRSIVKEIYNGYPKDNLLDPTLVVAGHLRSSVDIRISFIVNIEDVDFLYTECKQGYFSRYLDSKTLDALSSNVFLSPETIKNIKNTNIDNTK